LSRDRVRKWVAQFVDEDLDHPKVLLADVILQAVR
jgi:hypothetical protein